MTDASHAAAPGTGSGRLRVRAVVAYDGGPFRGFADNANVPTVVGTLRAALARTLRVESLELTGAGRTDAGVHALGQVITFDVDPATDLAALARSVNHQCAPGIAITALDAVDEGFDARFSATFRRYRYRVWNHAVHDPFTAATAWHVPNPLLRPAMELACDPLVGEHDFSALCRRPRRSPDQPEPSMVRRVLGARWTWVDDPMLVFEITASSFCHQMVRSIVGFHVDIGLGRRSPADVLAVLRAKDRSTSPTVAPPHGLFLVEVGYDGWTSAGSTTTSSPGATSPGSSTNA